MKRIILAVLVSAFCGLTGASVQAAPVSQQAGIVTQGVSTDVVQKAQYRYNRHRRWGSGGGHRRWGSGGGHRRWGSGGHRRWGSGGHSRWRSHRRWGSGGGGWHNRWRSHRRWGSRRW